MSANEGMSVGQHAFVTIVFEAEIDLLELQARSMALYLPADLGSEIIVIDNCRTAMPAATIARLRAAYGPHGAHLTVLREKDVSAIPLTKGWRSQQVLKLAIADRIASPRYVVLDAKTHLIGPVGLDFFQAADGRPTVNVYGYEDHPLRQVLIDVLIYLGVDPAPYLSQFTATVAPFVLDTAIVREMMRAIEQRSGRTFADEFVRRELTEFFLYAGWIVASGRTLEEVYFFHQRFCKIIWGHLYSPADCTEAIEAAKAAGEPFFSVHRKAIVQFGEEQIALVAAFWVERGLFGDAASASRFLAEFKQQLEGHNRFANVRALPTKAVTVLRRVRRRILG